MVEISSSIVVLLAANDFPAPPNTIAIWHRTRGVKQSV
jgi:hypothetical protein